MLTTPIDRIVFYDIETIPQHRSLFEMSPRKQELFGYRFHKAYVDVGLDPNMGQQEYARLKAAMDLELKQLQESDFPHSLSNPEDHDTLVSMAMRLEKIYQHKASLFAEFNKIVCISVGAFKNVVGDLQLYIESFHGHDEKLLLQNFVDRFSGVFNSLTPQKVFIAFNAFNFDMPVIAKRLVYNGIRLPPFFDVAHLKPWERGHHCDPKKVWTFDIWDDSSSLDLLCECFGIPSSKDDIKGSDVFRVYYDEDGLDRIVSYCNRDIEALAALYMAMKQAPNKIVRVFA